MDKVLDMVYIAGLFDGEGTIGLYKKKDNKIKNRSYYYHTLVCLVNTNREVMEWMAKKLEINHHCVSRRKGKMKKTWSKCYVWFLGGLKDIIYFLSIVIPYLRIKRKQAELLLEYCLIRYKQPRKNFTYTSRQHQIYKLIKNLNRTGPK